MGDEQGLCGRNDDLATSAAVVLDPLLAEIWQLIWADLDGDAAGVDVISLDVLGGVLRLAYLQGYADASTAGDPGALFGELGVRDPSINRPTASGRRRVSGRARLGSSGRLGD